MFMMPLSFLFMWITGLLSIGILAGGIYIVWAWYVGTLLAAAWLVAGVLMLASSVAGRWIVVLMHRAGSDNPVSVRSGRQHRLSRPDGHELYVEIHGPDTGVPIVLTHGWSLDSTAWYYAKKRLSDRFRLILWDLPGVGQSSQPGDRDYSTERFAQDLRAVLELTGDRKALLLGHSIGGMTIQTFCRLFPDVVASRVAGIVLANTTHTDPTRTTIASGLVQALEKPVLVPLLYLTVWLWPVVWVMNVLSYLNGSAHISTRLVSFNGDVTRGQLDFTTRFTAKQSPAVLARGMLATFRFDETRTLASISVPVLVLIADSDRLTVPTAGQRIAATIPRAALVRIDRSGHCGIIEQERDYYDNVAQYAESLDAPSKLTAPVSKTARTKRRAAGFRRDS
jgi:pimeloyl-ACP methyl ester carboxylesterase